MSCSKWSYTPEKCDGDFCMGDCDDCPKSDINNNNSGEDANENICCCKQ